MTDGSMPQFGQRKEIYISKTMCCIHLPCCWSFVTHTVAPSTTAIMTYYICIPVTIFPSVATFNSRNSSNQIHTVISLSWLLYMVYNSGQYRTTPCPPPKKNPFTSVTWSLVSLTILLSSSYTYLKTAWSLMSQNKRSDATLRTVWQLPRHFWVPWAINYLRLWAVGAKNESNLSFLCYW